MTTTTTTSPSAASSSLLPGRLVEVRVNQGASEAPALAMNIPSIAVVQGAGRSWWRAAVPRHPWAWLALFVIACGWDRAAWRAVNAGIAARLESIEATELRAMVSALFSWRGADAAQAMEYFGYHAIKMYGAVYLPAAIAASLIIRPLFQADTGRVRTGLRRGVLLFLAPAAAGLVAEALKLVFRRQRPEYADGFMSFRFENFWNASGLGLPSSHAAVAVASAVAMTVLWPRWRWLWIALGALCVVSRVLAGAHFVSDAVLGTLVGLSAARAIVALDLRNNRGVHVPAS